MVVVGDRGDPLKSPTTGVIVKNPPAVFINSTKPPDTPSCPWAPVGPVLPWGPVAPRPVAPV